MGLFVAAELYCRFWLRMGNPPLHMSHAQIGHLFKPSQDVCRFGQRIQFNAYSMRSDDFPKEKATSNELRILFIGDSVINGGSLTDQSQLATELIQQQLKSDLDRPIVVGNASAGGWNPTNQLAYVKAFGLFDADLVVLVLSGRYMPKDPTSRPKIGEDSRFPDHSPILALQELAFRYLPGYLLRNKPSVSKWPDPRKLTYEEFKKMYRKPIQTYDAALQLLVSTIRRNDKSLLVAIHPSAREARGAREHGYGYLLTLLLGMEIQPIHLSKAYVDALDQGSNIYRDWIHLTAMGQQVLANALYEPIRNEL